MKTTLPVTLAALFLAFALAVCLVRLTAGVSSYSRQLESRQNDPAQTVYQSQSGGDAGSQQEKTYILREYDGRLGIFEPGGAVPQTVIDIYIKNLPETDQQALKQGVAAENYAALIRLLEDYVS